MTRTPLLWICGAPGVGKSTAAWQVLGRLSAQDVRTGYVDIDQLGICFPVAPDDPERTRLKARNLGTVVETFQAAGAHRLVVSGVVTAREAPAFTSHAAGSAITWALLQLEPTELRNRLQAVGWNAAAIADALRYADEVVEGSFADVTLRVGRLSTAYIAELLLELPTKAANTPPAIPPPVEPARPEPLPLLWISGARASGKSAVGWEVFRNLIRAGVRTLLLDLRQLGFLRPGEDGDPGTHAIRARNVGAILRHSDARAAVVTGPLVTERELRSYSRELLPDTPLTLVRLRASPEELRGRLQLRAAGSGWREAGDDLVGMLPDELDARWRKAIAESDRLDRAGIADLVVDTAGRSPAAIAEQVLAKAPGWSQLLATG